MIASNVIRSVTGANRRSLLALARAYAGVNTAFGIVPMRQMIVPQHSTEVISSVFVSMFLSELGANHKDLHRFNKKLHGGETDKDQHTEMAARIITELLPSLLARGVIRQEVLEEWNYPMDRITRAASFLRTELEKEEDEHENS